MEMVGKYPMRNTESRSIPVLALMLAVLLLLAGCAGPAVPAEPSTPDTTSGDGTAASDPRGPATGTDWTVTITRVIDGDTVEARFPNGEVDTIRLLGVDTPETTYSRVSPDEYEGFPETTAAQDHLFNWGERASQYATDTLSGNEVRLVLDDEADRRGYFGRLLGYLYVDGENFNKQLLSQGYARLYESSFSQEAAFEAAEQDARENNIGLWDFTVESESESDGDSPGGSGAADGTSSGFVVADIHADAEGNDHENLNDEYVVFKNTGESNIDMGGWTVSDAAGHTYTIPSGFELESEGSVTLHTGTGSDSESDLYWAAESAVWNNAGDTVTVRNASGSVVVEREY